MRLKRWSVAAALVLGLAGTSLVFADPRIEGGTYKAEGKLNGESVTSTFKVEHVEGRKYRVTWNGQVGDKKGSWSSEGYDNGSRLVIEWTVVSSDGMAGALRELGGNSEKTVVRGVFDISGGKLAVDLYEVPKPGQRKSLGSQSGVRVEGGADDEGGEGGDVGEGADTEEGEGDSGWVDAGEGEGDGTMTGDDATTGEGDGAATGEGDGSAEGDAGEGSGDMGDGATTGEEPEGGESNDTVLEPERDLAITLPEDGAVALVGQVLDVVVEHPTATIDAEGPVEVGADRKLRVTGEGEFTLRARVGEAIGAAVKGRAIQAQVTRLEVLDALQIVDARPPHYQRERGSDEIKTQEPAAILSSQRLRLQVEVQAEENLSAPAKVILVGRDSRGKAVLSGEAELKGLRWGEKVTVQTAGVLESAVAINSLNLEWSVAGAADVTTSGTGDAATTEVARSVALTTPSTPLRVYTSYRSPVNNVSWGGGGDIKTKYHYEMACTWANGASRNVGSGSDSIAWNIDNRMRHYVHTKDFGSANPPVTYYGPEQEPPINYADLPSAWRTRNGERPISSLYYPPLEPKEEYQEYENYRRNFGWWLLDNPTHTGGRCNQQAALVTDIVGLLGIKASVHYLQRTGFGKRSGRPVRMYFYAAGGSGPWNFHGIVRVELEEGEWLYDGSFSSPPNRLNGERSWAEKPGGPFIQSWAYWLYDDVPYSERVPENDIPKTWDGIQ